MSGTSSVRARSPGKLALSLLATIVFAGVAFSSLVLSYARGALDIARDDDWSYLSTVLSIVDHQEFVLNGWVHMMFLSQGLMGSAIAIAFGESIFSLQLLVFGLGLLGLVCLIWLSLQVLSMRLTFLVLILTGLSPLLLHLSVTFMTDIPAWSLSLASIALAIKAYRELSPLWLLGAALLGLLGFGVREYAVVPMLVVLLWIFLSSSPRRFRLWSIATAGMVAILSTLAYSWRQTVPGSLATEVTARDVSAVGYSSLLLTFALLLAPYLAIASVMLWPLRTHLLKVAKHYWLGAALGVVAGIGIAAMSSGQFAGNVIHPYGSSWTSVGDGVRSVPLWGYRVIAVVGAIGLVALLLLIGMLAQKFIATKARSVTHQLWITNDIIGMYTAICMSVFGVYLITVVGLGAPVFDRYLLLPVPLLGIVILWLATRSLKEQISKWQKSVIALIVVVTGAFGIVITDGLNQVDGLRWQVASELVDSGIPAYKIDGGDAWFRFHQKDAPGVAQVGSLENEIPGRTWWQTFFEGSTLCRMVAIESETDLQAMYGPAFSIREERTLLGTPFRIMVFPGPDPC